MGNTCKFSYKVSGIDLMIILNGYFWFSPITVSTAWSPSDQDGYHPNRSKGPACMNMKKAGSGGGGFTQST